MTTRTPIVRIPIKIRKPIYKEFCDCWNTKVFSIKGVPYFILGDSLSMRELVKMLDSLDQGIGFYFSDNINKCKEKVLYVLSKGLPVTIKTNCVLPTEVVDALRSVPHSAIHISINFLDKSLRKRLEPESSDLFDLREMMFLSKSYKIFVVVVMNYQPHLVSKLDLYEIIDMTKNHIAHMMIKFPNIKDEEYHTYKNQWESLNTSSLEKFRQFYVADVPSRSWDIRHKYQKTIIQELQTYLKPKKINLEIINSWETNDRVRHDVSGLSDLPTGMRPFFYHKDGDMFVRAHEPLDQVCNTCSKSVFA